MNTQLKSLYILILKYKGIIKRQEIHNEWTDYYYCIELVSDSNSIHGYIHLKK